MNKHFFQNKPTCLILWLALSISIPISPAHAASDSTNPPALIKGSVVTERGTVIENVTELAKVDGPAYLRVKKEDGSIIKVIYSPGEAECQNPFSEAFHIRKKHAVEVHGLAVGEDTISTCESTEYYIKAR